MKTFYKICSFYWIALQYNACIRQKKSKDDYFDSVSDQDYEDNKVNYKSHQQGEAKYNPTDDDTINTDHTGNKCSATQLQATARVEKIRVTRIPIKGAQVA